MDAWSDIEMHDRALFFDDTLVLSDLHTGKVVASNVELPVGEGRDMVERVENLCERFEPAEIVIAGDLLHSFQTVPRMVKETLGGLQAAASQFDAEIIVTPGNHDTMLDVVWSGRTTPEYQVGETLICHGHVEPEGSAERYIVGHDHPTITIEGQNHPCYLAGEDSYRDAPLLMLPAFNRLITGVTINDLDAADLMCPLVASMNAFAPIVWDEEGVETLHFPPLGEFRHKL